MNAMPLLQVVYIRPIAFRVGGQGSSANVRADRRLYQPEWHHAANAIGEMPALMMPTMIMASPTVLRSHTEAALRRSSGSPRPAPTRIGNVPNPKPDITSAPPSHEPES